MKILCTGGRDYKDYEAVEAALDEHEMYADLNVVVGDARGADALVREWCRIWRIDCDVHYAEWQQHGKKAGHLRNAAMIATKPDLVIAFPGGIGTANCVRQAKKAGIPVIEIV